MDDAAARPGRRALGADGPVVSPMAYGCAHLAEASTDDARARIEAAVESGIDLIDTADVYGALGGAGFGAAEERLGAVLAADPGLRERIVIATKAGVRGYRSYDTSPAILRRAIDDSRRRLGIDVIDLWQIHRPDLLAHPAAVADVLAEAVAGGAVRAIGISNHSVWQYEALRGRLAGSPATIATNQIELHALRPEALTDGTLDLAARDDVVPLAWSPLGDGRLGDGAAARGQRETAVHAVLDRVAAESGTTRSTVALAWVMRQPTRPVPIIGTTRPERIRAAAAALDLTLDRDGWLAVTRAATASYRDERPRVVPRRPIRRVLRRLTRARQA